MKKLLTTLMALAVGSSLALAAKGGGKRNPEDAFKKLDGNSDSSLSLDEFKAGPMGKKDPAKAEEIFKKKDKDSDGKLTLEEFKAGGGKKKK
jgi:Ca2+-binding EF-hand superfamily protein